MFLYLKSVHEYYLTGGLHNYPIITVIVPHHTSKWYHLDTKTFCTEKQMSDIQYSKDN